MCVSDQALVNLRDSIELQRERCIASHPSNRIIHSIEAAMHILQRDEATILKEAHSFFESPNDSLRFEQLQSLLDRMCLDLAWECPRSFRRTAGVVTSLMLHGLCDKCSVEISTGPNRFPPTVKLSHMGSVQPADASQLVQSLVFVLYLVAVQETSD